MSDLLSELSTTSTNLRSYSNNILCSTLVKLFTPSLSLVRVIFSKYNCPTFKIQRSIFAFQIWEGFNSLFRQRFAWKLWVFTRFRLAEFHLNRKKTILTPFSHSKSTWNVQCELLERELRRLDCALIFPCGSRDYIHWYLPPACFTIVKSTV